jgi:hypothetical protein
MLVGPEPVESELRGEQQLVDGLVVEVPGASGVGQLRPGSVDPHRSVAPLHVVREVAVRHEVK